jgi:hypothetical protein
MDDDGCKGLMSQMAVVQGFEHGNIITAWDSFKLVSSVQLYLSIYIYIYTYKDI